MATTSHYQVVIVGGGTAGISVAARLAGKVDSLAVIEPSDKHFYQPLWTLVGGGCADRTKSERDQASLIPKGVTWVKDAVTSFDPDNNSAASWPRIAWSGSNVFVAWTDGRSAPGTQVYSNASTDGGASFRTTSVRVDESTRSGSQASELGVAQHTGELGVVHFDRFDGAREAHRVRLPFGENDDGSSGMPRPECVGTSGRVGVV